MNQVPRKQYEQLYVCADLFTRLTSCPATQNRDLLRVSVRRAPSMQEVMVMARERTA
jgi:hypothetical protein